MNEYDAYVAAAAGAMVLFALTLGFASFLTRSR